MHPQSYNSSAPNWDGFFYVVFATGFLFVGGGFDLHMTGVDPSQARSADAGSPISQTVLGAFYIVGTLFLLTRRKGVSFLVRAWPILLFPLLALISAFWSPDPLLTIRKGCSYLGAVLFGLSFASAFSIKDCISVTVRVLALSMLLSLVWVILVPRFGVHQSD